MPGGASSTRPFDPFAKRRGLFLRRRLLGRSLLRCRLLVRSLCRRGLLRRGLVLGLRRGRLLRRSLLGLGLFFLHPLFLRGPFFRRCLLPRFVFAVMVVSSAAAAATLVA